METDSPVVYHGTSESRFPPKEGQLQQLSMTQQEKEVFQDCHRESLYYRCLPFALVGIAATHMAVKKGILSSHPVWGSGLKMSGAAFVGWLLGKLSYRRACEDKFLQLENSAIGDAIRKNRGYVVDKDEIEFFGSKSEDLELKKDSYTSYSDYHSSIGSLNLDVDKNVQYSGLDDRERPSADKEGLPISEDAEPTRIFTTYDDLRKKNREEYVKSQRPYAQKSDQTNQPLIQRPWRDIDSTPPRRFNMEPNEGSTKNKYGDTWDNTKFL